MYEIVFYSDANGNEPALDFLLGLDTKMRAKMLMILKLAEEYGPALREPHSKSLEDGIHEFRAKVGSNITRTLYFFCVGKKIVLTNGFTKKTDKTPRGEIERAKKCRIEYLERSGNSD